MLDIKKVYVDTRFKTPDSKSDSDLFIELPRSLNVPDNVICYITDVVIPVSWSTIDARNNNLYMHLERGEDKTYKKKALAQMNYNGTTFSAALEATVNNALTSIVSFDVLYDLNDNMISIKQRDNFEVKATIVCGADLLVGNVWILPVSKTAIQSLNGVLRIGKTSYEFKEGFPYVAYIDLHTTRNLYITSSSLASYNTISNFETDVIIQKVAVKANYSEMLFDSADAGYGFLDVSRRALSRIDFRLQDSFGNIIDLRNNHWSFSLVFQIHNN
jgi:hypothetical protein